MEVAERVSYHSSFCTFFCTKMHLMENIFCSKYFGQKFKAFCWLGVWLSSQWFSDSISWQNVEKSHMKSQCSLLAAFPRIMSHPCIFCLHQLLLLSSLSTEHWAQSSLAEDQIRKGGAWTSLIPPFTTHKINSFLREKSSVDQFISPSTIATFAL